jgi:hypothetical protein
MSERLAADPGLVDRARERVATWLEDGSVARPYAEAWDRLLRAPALAVEASAGVARLGGVPPQDADRERRRSAHASERQHAVVSVVADDPVRDSACLRSKAAPRVEPPDARAADEPQSGESGAVHERFEALLTIRASWASTWASSLASSPSGSPSGVAAGDRVRDAGRRQPVRGADAENARDGQPLADQTRSRRGDGDWDAAVGHRQLHVTRTSRGCDGSAASRS